MQRKPPAIQKIVGEMMKILFVDKCSRETCLADVSIRCSNPPPGERCVSVWGEGGMHYSLKRFTPADITDSQHQPRNSNHFVLELPIRKLEGVWGRG